MAEPDRVHCGLFEILPHLFLSTFQSAQESASPDAYVVNCTRDLPMVRHAGMRIAVDDNGSPEAMYDLRRALPEAVANIHAHVSRGVPVVVHCLAGRQRSPAVVAAYLMKHRGITLTEAIQFVRSKKRDAFFATVNFREALAWYARTL